MEKDGEKKKGKQKKSRKTLVILSVCGQNHEEDDTDKKKKKKESRLGRDEREMMLAITGPQRKLPYPLVLLQMSDGTFTKEYVIPEEEKEKVLQDLYLFSKVPSMDMVMFDVHEQKYFKVNEFRVIREGGGNFIVSPYYPVSGGTLLDWVGEGSWKTEEGDVVAEANVIGKWTHAQDESNDEEHENDGDSNVEETEKSEEKVVSDNKNDTNDGQ